MTRPLSLADVPADDQAVAAYQRRVHAAVREYRDRRARRAEPLGSRTSLDEHCWYPDPVHEARPCCRSIRPTRTSEQALWQHCRGSDHIAHLHDIHPADLRSALRSQ